MYTNKHLISLGNFLFKRRNLIFPITLIIIFLIFPPGNTFLGSAELEDTKDLIAYCIAAIGLCIRAAVIGYAYIKRGGVNKKVYADGLVTTGIFAICRNPLYIANIIIYFSVFLMHGDIMVIIFGTLLFCFIYSCLVATEENFLRNRFDAEYYEYCASTHRWIPDLARLKQSISGLKFDLRKVIYKDYTTIASTYIALVAIELYEEIVYANDKASVLDHGYVLIGLVVFTFFVRVFKKSHPHQPR